MMYRRLLAAALALCLMVGFATQIGIAQEPKTLEERVAALEAKVAELTEMIEEMNQRFESLEMLEALLLQTHNYRKLKPVLGIRS